MATIRKHRNKWQVQIRRTGLRPTSRSFALRKDALEWTTHMWTTHMERQADRHELPTDPKALQRVTLGDVVKRYRDTVKFWFWLDWKLKIYFIYSLKSSISGTDKE
jgi:hypothetical protein